MVEALGVKLEAVGRPMTVGALLDRTERWWHDDTSKEFCPDDAAYVQALEDGMIDVVNGAAVVEGFAVMPTLIAARVPEEPLRVTAGIIAMLHVRATMLETQGHGDELESLRGKVVTVLTIEAHIG